MTKEVGRCSQCKTLVEEAKLVFIDDTAFCAGCIYDNSEPFEIYPIGIVRNNISRDLDTEFGRMGDPEQESRIELFNSQKPFMYRLEEEEYLTVIFYLHRAKWPRSVINRETDLKEVGIFASRSPDRLSRIAVTDVRLTRIEGTTLFVTDLDAIDGSPVLDIKYKGQKGESR